jgi:arylsulfatase A-like enzyme
MALGCLVAVVAMSVVRPPARPNIVLITIDTLRPDRLSAYGYDRHRTPHLDRLAAEGTLFENAFCDVTWTTPSMASVMTGRYATGHGFRTPFQTLRADATTLAELLRAHGFRTAAVIGSLPLHSIFGLSQGFALYDEDFSEPLMNVEARTGTNQLTGVDDAFRARQTFLDEKARTAGYRPDSAVSDRVIRWLQTSRREPFFLWIHYYGPHEKLTAATDVSEQHRLQVSQYDADVLIADTQVGRVLETLDALDLTARTAVVLHADHGQSLLEHSYFGHGRYLYDTVARVPLIVRWPGRVAAGQRVQRLVRNIDIFPTILEIAGVPAPAADGASLLAAADGDRGGGTYIETYLSTTWLFADVDASVPGGRVGIRRLAYRTLHWKYVVNDPVMLFDRPDSPVPEALRRRYYSEELYDVDADSAETVNVLPAHPEIADALRSAVQTQQASTATKTAPMALDDSVRARLRELGYLAD